MMKKLAINFFSACLISQALTLLGFGIAQAFSVSSYMPLTTGNTWTYQINGQNGFTRSVTGTSAAINGVIARQILYSEGGYEFVSNDASGILLHQQYVPSLYVAGYGYAAVTATYSPAIVMAPADATLGLGRISTGTATLTVQGVGTFAVSYSTSSTPLNFETVTTPAGSYAALKIQMNLNVFGFVNGTNVSASETDTYWLAQYLGVVKFAETSNSVTETGVLTGTNVVIDSTPDAFSFAPVSSANRGSYVESASITVSGINVPSSITVSGGEYSIDGGPYTGNAGSVTVGQRVTVRVMSAQTGLATRQAVLNIGGIQGIFAATTGPYSASAADFSGDHKSDILWRHADGRNAIWLIDGTTVTGAALTTAVPDSGWGVKGVGDFNGDGRADILWRHADGRNAVWLMDGTTLAAGALITTVPDSGWTIAGVGDFNGDGRADILWRHADGRNAIWLMDGTTFTGGALIAAVPDSGWTVKGVGDFNGDGNSDILWRHSDGRNAIWLMNGTTMISGALTTGVTDSGWSIQGVGDFNGDGKSDILWRHSDGRNAIWLMDGFTLASGALITTVADSGWSIQEAGDFNADGKADILWRHADGRNAIWLMDGFNFTGGALLPTVTDSGWAIQR